MVPVTNYLIFKFLLREFTNWKREIFDNLTANQRQPKEISEKHFKKYIKILKLN